MPGDREFSEVPPKSKAAAIREKFLRHNFKATKCSIFEELKHNPEV